MLGPEAGDDKEISILNRVVRWEKGHLKYEADPRHVEKLLRGEGLEDCRSLSTPGVKTNTASVILEDGVDRGSHAASPGDHGVQTVDSQPRKLDRQRTTRYRSVVARCNFLGTDRFEVAFAAKELCRTMSCPAEEDLASVRRLPFSEGVSETRLEDRVRGF